MYKEVIPKKKRSAPPRGVRGKAYVRYTPKMLYINSQAMEMLGEADTVSISINGPERVMIITPDGPWKLSRVCETRDAKRIETNGGLVSMLDAGFPKGMIGKYLSCHIDMTGALAVSLIPQYDTV
jgi:hypothetical protein